MAPTHTALAQKRRKRLLVALLVLVGVPIALLGFAFMFLESTPGRALLRKQVLAAADGALEGKLEAGGIELRGGNHLVLTSLKLFTPEGELVASIERLEADVDLGALARKRLRLSDVKVESPQLLLVQDERGWNLSRAVATEPSTRSAATTPNNWRVEIEDFELSEGLLDLKQEDRRVTATRLTARGDAQLRFSPLEIAGSLELSSALTAPLQETLSLKVAARASNGPQRYDLSLLLGGSQLKGLIELPSLSITIDELVAAPRELSAFVPSWPIVPVVFGKGSLLPTQATLQLSAGKARVTLDAKYDLENNAAQTLAVRGTDVDLAELLGAKMNSDLGFEVNGSLTDWRPETLAGALSGNATWDAKGGKRLATVRLDVGAQKGVLKVSALEATTPGLSLRARGTLDQQTVEAFGTLTAKDLGQLAATLRAFAGVELKGLGGHGTLRLSVKGPLKGPAATVLGKLEKVSIAGVQAEELAVNAEVPDVSQPLDTDVLLHAKRLSFGERAFDDVTFDFVTHGRKLDVDLATKGMGDLRLHALAQLDKDSRGLQLEAVELTSTEARWELESPARMSWADGFSLSPFSLRNQDQRISGELTLTDRLLGAKVHLEALDLAKLPHVLALPSLQLGGTLTADVVATGKPRKPSVKIDAQLNEGKVKGLEGLAAKVKASWADDRAKGTLQAQSGLGKVEGTFDVPVLAFLQEKPGEGTARITLKEVPLQEVQRQLGKDLPLTGTLSGRLDLSGSGDHPKLQVTIESPELTYTLERKQVSVKAVKFSAFTTDAATLDATASFSSFGSLSELTLSTPLTLAALRKQVPTADELLSLPVSLTVSVRNLDLRELDRLRPVQDDELAGTVSLNALITGSARAPVGELTLSLEEFTLPPLKKASALLNLRTDAHLTRLTGSASVPGQGQAVEFSASVQALPERAFTALLGPQGDGDAMIEALRDVPLQLQVTLRPFPLAQAIVQQEGEPERGGKISATLDVGGTLEAPTARLVGALQNLQFDQVKLGSGRFDLKSSGTAQRFTVALGGEGRDDFKAKGTLGLDVRLSKLRRGLDWRSAPIDLTVESRNFDVGFLSGVTELLRAVAGRVDLSGKISGKLGQPSFVGDGTVRGGRVALAGFGDYRDISLQLHATNDLIEVKRLEASSGAGKVELVARATRQPSGAFMLTSTGRSDRFPIVVDDQLQATASLRYVLEGDATASLIDVRRLELTRVEVALPEVKRKDLQDLVRPTDIIVLRNGQRPTQRRRQQALQASAAGATKPMVVRALVDAPRNIWVRSSDVNVELGLSKEFKVELNDGLRLFGEARVIRGEVKVIGREFTVQRDSQARFAGPPAQPYINVSALHINSREQVKITVTVTGKGTDVAIKVASEPPMSESDIYAVLATGRRNLKTGGGATLSPGQAASVVGQLAATQLKNVIAKKLPIDVFNFDTSDNFEKVKLDVGKYLSDTVYLGGSVDIGAKRERGENVWSGRLELQLNKSISLEAYAGDALSFGADAMWSRDF